MSRSRASTLRWISITVMTILIVIAVSEVAQQFVPAWNFLLAIGTVLAWMLGQRYEREVIVESNLAARGDVVEAERDDRGWLF